MYSIVWKAANDNAYRKYECKQPWDRTTITQTLAEMGMLVMSGGYTPGKQ